MSPNRWGQRAAPMMVADPLRSWEEAERAENRDLPALTELGLFHAQCAAIVAAAEANARDEGSLAHWRDRLKAIKAEHRSRVHAEKQRQNGDARPALTIGRQDEERGCNPLDQR